MSGHEANRRLARTMNLGLALDAPVEGEWGLTIRPDHLRACREAGFTAVRVPVQWAERTTSEPPYAIVGSALDRVDEIVAQARALGLTTVLGNHPDEALMADPAAHRDRFLAHWRELTNRLAHVPDEVLYFEPLCEPHGALEPYWNELLAAVVDVVRTTSPGRPVVVGPTGHNRADRLSSLLLPEDDRNLIVTFHYYLPIPFTMQGEAWLADVVPDVDVAGWLGTTWTPADPELTTARRVFAEVARWASEHDRPVFLGEFGVTANADEASRAAWIAAHRVEAERHDFSWGYWSFGSLFSAYDVERDAWREDVLTALIPRGERRAQPST